MNPTAFIRQYACAYTRTSGVRDDKRVGQERMHALTPDVWVSKQAKKKRKKKKGLASSTRQRVLTPESLVLKLLGPQAQKEIWNPQAKKPWPPRGDHNIVWCNL